MILTLNNTDTSVPRGGNGFFSFERPAWLAFRPGLGAGLSLRLVSFSNSGEGGAGRSGWVFCVVCVCFFFPLSLPCGVLNCLPTDVIQPLKNSFFLARLNDSSHSQRRGVRFQAGGTTGTALAGNAAAAQGRARSPADPRLPEGSVFLRSR